MSGCELHRSLCHDTYTTAPFVGAEAVPLFVDHRKLAYKNFIRNRRSSLNLVDDELLKRNFTTTNTLEFQEIPRLRLIHASGEKDKTVLRSSRWTWTDCKPSEILRRHTITSFGSSARKCWTRSVTCRPPTPRALTDRGKKPIFEFGPDYDGVVKFDLTC